MKKKIISQDIPRIIFSISRIFLLTTAIVLFFCFSLLLWGKINSNIKEEYSPSATNSLKIGFITDLHIKSNSIYGDRTDRKIKDSFVETIENFQNEMSENFHPDVIVNNGDVIEGTNRDWVVGTGELLKTRWLFDNLSIPTLWVLGNHDLRAVNKDQWKESLKIDYLFKSFDFNGYRIIVLDSNFDNFGKEDIEPGKYFTRGRLNELQLKWLQAELNASPKETLIFIHHPPLVFTDIQTPSQLLFNAQEFQDIVSKNGNVLAVFSGHIEELHHKIKDGVHYFIIPGTTKSPEFLRNFAEIEVDGKNLEVQIHYQEDDGSYVSRDISSEID